MKTMRSMRSEITVALILSICILLGSYACVAGVVIQKHGMEPEMAKTPSGNAGHMVVKMVMKMPPSNPGHVPDQTANTPPTNTGDMPDTVIAGTPPSNADHAEPPPKYRR